jgi:chaperonin cofactor prefoldin
MSNNTVMINDSSYVFDDMSEKAQAAYQQLLSLRNQMADLSMRQQQIAAAQSVFEKALEEELAEQPAEAELADVG